MRQFFKFLFASCLGTLLALLAILVIITGTLSSLSQQASAPKDVKPNSVLRLKLDQPIPELTDNSTNLPISLNQSKSRLLGVHDISRIIRAAAKDKDIKGIFLETTEVQAGFATSTLIREELEAFRKTGKFVIAHAPYYSQGAYYLASAANAVYVAPQGLVDLRGFAAQVPFFKELLDKVGIDMQVYYAGEFKSATEPYRRTSISPENKLQTRELLEGMYDMLLEDISRSRKTKPEQLRQAVSTYAGRTAEGAREAGLIDGIAYREEVLAIMRRKLGIKTDKEISFIGANAYYDARVRAEEKQADKIAVVIAEGNIVDGKGDAGSIGDEDYVAIIDELRQDKRVKAVVLRINSPGGSASASDHIWESLMLLKETGKPLVVSMGDYAASGGYYIAAPADTIFAQRNTITGSIGVFLLFPSVQKLMNDKLGVRFDTVLTAPYAAGFTPVQQLSEAEGRMLQERTDWLYQVFLGKVGRGRNMSVAGVDSVARGRVWLADRAQQIGLVDEIGGLDEAIQTAASMAGLTTYEKAVYPSAVSPIERLFKELMEEDEDLGSIIFRQKMGQHQPYIQFMESLSQPKGVQARMPFLIDYR